MSKMLVRVRMVTVAVLLGGATSLTGAVGPAQAAGACVGGVAGDVNADGYAEVAISDLNKSRAGSVHVLFGEVGGLVTDPAGTARNDEHLSQATPGVSGTSESGDEFGASLVLADFDGDGCADLAVGVPGEDQGRGRIVVFPGSTAGLGTTGVRSFSEDALLGAGASKPGEEFGASMAAGDFDDDGVSDLVVGAPGEEVASRSASGAVVVLPGSADGLTGDAPARLISEDSAGVPGDAEFGDGFGFALAPADYDGNGVTDLAVGAIGEDNAGSVTVLDGHAGTGLSGAGSVVLSQNSSGIRGASEQDDDFGAALAGGDVDGDGRAELVIGVPGENRDTREEQDGPDGKGAVVVVPGSPTGPEASISRVWNQNSPAVAGVAGFYDRFGSTLVIAPLDDDRFSDLAVGTPNDEVGGARFAGSVTLLRGSAHGLTTAGVGGSRITSDSRGIAGSSGGSPLFGSSLVAAPTKIDSQWSLVVGAPFEKVGSLHSGRVHALASPASGPTGVGSQSFSHSSYGLKGTAGTGFGSTLG